MRNLLLRCFEKNEKRYLKAPARPRSDIIWQSNICDISIVVCLLAPEADEGDARSRVWVFIRVLEI